MEREIPAENNDQPEKSGHLIRVKRLISMEQNMARLYCFVDDFLRFLQRLSTCYVYRTTCQAKVEIQLNPLDDTYLSLMQQSCQQGSDVSGQQSLNPELK